MTQPPPQYPSQPIPQYGGWPPPQPPPYPPVPPGAGRKWWQHPALAVGALVLFPPGGIALTWLGRWNRAAKVIATVLSTLWFFAPFMGTPPKDPVPVAAGGTAQPPSFLGQNLKDAKSGAQKAGYDSVSHDATEKDAGQWADGNWTVCFQSLTAKKTGSKPVLDFGVVRNGTPCPAADNEAVRELKMPQLVGQPFAKAAEALAPLSLQSVKPTGAYTNVTLPAAVDDWTVCFQDPKEGRTIPDPKTTAARLALTAPGTPCPANENTALPPPPAPPTSAPPATTPPPAENGTTTSGGTSNGSSSSGGSTSGGSATGGSTNGGSASGGSSSEGSSSGGSTVGGSSSGGSSGGGTSTTGGGSDTGGGGSAGGVTPGAFCSTPGATGIGKANGRTYTCKGPEPYRWRS
ncbi:hypothetical protein [Kitasatospora sp. NPDC088134]|uniref:hypothetical protein n=1 Tax=Kitasatospora sp. NPDC088134 TaxID=3364071 RepID=UPI0038157DB4